MMPALIRTWTSGSKNHSYQLLEQDNIFPCFSIIFAPVAEYPVHNYIQFVLPCQY